MKGAKTTKGNPFKLTREQHIIPRLSIKRFENADKKVKVNLVEPRKSFSAKSSNSAFCVDRVWDQRSEAAWMRGIENRYQNLASLCHSRLQRKLSGSQHEIVSRMYLLIYLRIKFSKNAIEDYKFNGKKMAYSLSKLEMELLESRHVTAIDGNGNINSRSITGNVMQMKLDQSYSQYFLGAEWAILTAGENEYIFSDGYNGYRVLPISPKLCFIVKEDINNEPRLTDAKFVNKIGTKYAQYLFFEACESD